VARSKFICPKCLRAKKPTSHHVWPKRFFGGAGPLLKLCRECHDNIESLIPATQRLSTAEYETIARNFLVQPRRRDTSMSQFAFRRR